MALSVILLVGCSPRKLNFGLVAVGMFVSMWISNTAAIAMMCPIIEATLKELEDQGIVPMYEDGINKDKDDDMVENGEVTVKEPPKPPGQRRPSRTTICFFLTAAYAASIGGSGTIVGSGTNLTFKGELVRGNRCHTVEKAFLQGSTKPSSPTVPAWDSFTGSSSTCPSC